MQIIVLGMHRTGTSALTKVINLMGAYFGEDSIALPASADNPKGFWERRDVLACNRELLRLSGCTWHVVHRWNAANLSSVTAPISLQMQQITSELTLNNPSVVKDPRFCLTLPYWLSYFPKPLVVCCYRNPLEIAQSLHLRNAMPPEYALALWEFHMVHAIRIAKPLPKLFVSHAALMNNPLGETQKLFASLTQSGANHLTLPSKKVINDFIDPSLQRARGSARLFSLNPFQELLASMWHGETPMDGTIQVSSSAMHILESQGTSVSGAPK